MEIKSAAVEERTCSTFFKGFWGWLVLAMLVFDVGRREAKESLTNRLSQLLSEVLGYIAMGSQSRRQTGKTKA